jgi:uncharacterized protein YjbI with pentapeptide repeats
MVIEQQSPLEVNINKRIPPSSDDEKRLWLQRGWPLEFSLPNGDSDSTEARAKRTIQAAWLEQLATKDTHVIQVPISITNAIIEGNLSLKYVSFEQEISISNSEFLGSCDFSFAIFNRTTSFIASQFYGKAFFRSSNAKCDFIITRAQFHNDVQFIEMNVGALLSAEGASFQDADFAFIKVTTIANFNPVSYEGTFIPVNFIGGASFFGAEFLGAAAFIGAQFKKSAKFEGLNVKHRITFDTFENNDEVLLTYLNNATFDRAQIQGGASFIGAFFNEKASFQNAEIGGVTDFSASRGNEKILTTFNDEVSFSGVLFKNDVFFNGAQFMKKAHFNDLRVGGTAIFATRRIKGEQFVTKFNDEVSFLGAVFERGIQFNGAQFLKYASFNRIKVQDTAQFRAVFNNDEIIPVRFNDEVNFSESVFESAIQFNGAQFLKKAHFNGIKVQDIALFSPVVLNNEVLPVRFMSDAMFLGAQFKMEAFFDSTCFMKDATFLSTQFNEGAFFNGFEKRGGEPTRFEGDASFIDAYIGTTAFFQGAQFNGKATFYYTQFNNANFGPLQIRNKITPVTFGGKANFNGAYIKGDADFRGAQFKDEAVFQQTRIEQRINLGPAKIGDKVLFTKLEGKANFDRMLVQGDAIFNSAHFMGETSFVRIHIGKNTLFNSDVYEDNIVPSQFDKHVEFSGAHLLGAASFIGAKFKSDVVFEFVQFDSNTRFIPYVKDNQYEQVTFSGAALFSGSVFKQEADFRGADFSGRVDFRRAEINGAALFVGASFNNIVSFREAKFNIAIFREEGIVGAWSDINRDLTAHIKDTVKQFDGKVDLRGFLYERIYVNWKEMFDHLVPYDRQPYSQLEKTLRLAGHDRQAEDIYKSRRNREGKQLWDKVFRRNDFQDLPLLDAFREIPRALLDKSQQLLFNYGIRPYRLIVLSLIVVFIGTFIFSRSGAVIHKDKDARSNQEDKIQLDKSEAVNVSLHQFIPVVDITPGDEWIPSGRPMPLGGMLNISFAGYATFHRLAGAILVPLGIVALTGLLQRKEK